MKQRRVVKKLVLKGIRMLFMSWLKYKLVAYYFTFVNYMLNPQEGNKVQADADPPIK